MPDTEHIGKYEILEELGRGGFATVYKAKDPTLDRLVALKVLHPNWLAAPEFSTRFRNEVRAVAKLRHPHIVTIHEIGDIDGLLYIAMEYLPGMTLQAYLENKGPISLQEALPILDQIAGALDYAHSRGIVHRDIKPANIMVEETEDGLQVTLTDFGLVKILSESNAFTTAGDILGSPEYMAPEQADPNRANEIGPAIDLYALGVLAYRMLTGRVPFPGNTPATLLGHLNLDPPDPLEFVPGLFPKIATVLLKMLAKTPGDRYPSAKEFVGQMRYIVQHEQLRLEQEVQLAELYRNMRGAMERSDWEKALVLGEKIQKIRPGYSHVVDLMSLARQSLRPKPATSIPVIPTWGWSVVGVSIVVLFLIINPGGLLDNWALSPEVTKIAMPSGDFEAGYTWTRPVDGMEMVYVPGGEFEMGSESGDDDELPVHTVKLDAFWMDRTEVTNAQFAKCVQAGQCEAPTSCAWESPTYGESEMLDHPVVCVDWYGAEAYCEWVGGELPTEAEWEYAAGGPKSLLYPWGNEWREKYANCAKSICKDGYEETSPVGSFLDGASWCKALDMSGNVWEWVADWYGYYPSERQVNPVGPDHEIYRVLRGGSWWNGSETSLRCVRRSWINPTDSYNILGFRCAAGSSRGE